MKKHLLLSAVLVAVAVTAFSQDSSQQPGTSAETNSAATANKTLVLTPVIYFDEHPFNHNMHITADSNYYYAINGGNSGSGQINKFDLTGTLLQTYPILIDGRGLSYNKADGFLYASLYMGDIVRIDDLATGTFTMLFPAAMQNGQASFAISDDGTKFYDFSAGTLRIHDFNSGVVINTIFGLLSGAGNYGGEAAVAVDSTYIYTWNSAIKTVYVYDTAGTFQQSFTISDGDNGHALSFADNKLFVSRDGNYNIGTWYGYDISVLTGMISASTENYGFTIYPNPAGGKVNISGHNISDIKIWNVLGEQLYTDRSKNQTNAEIDVSCFQSGIYFLEALVDGNRTVKKLVKE